VVWAQVKLRHSQPKKSLVKQYSNNFSYIRQLIAFSEALLGLNLDISGGGKKAIYSGFNSLAL